MQDDTSIKDVLFFFHHFPPSLYEITIPDERFFDVMSYGANENETVHAVFSFLVLANLFIVCLPKKRVTQRPGKASAVGKLGM